ncbi:MAG: hypothetical protein QM765_39950 [Myxococcales bacterium]
MLTRRRLSATAASLALLLSAGAARAQEEAVDGLKTPERVTAGASTSDQFLGQLAPDGKRLYLVSNRSIANEVLWLDVEKGTMKSLFDEGAETTWPRVSPDGKRLLYLSFRERASGGVCIRDLPDGTDWRCLDEPGGAIQAEWISDSRIALVARASVQGDLHLLEVAVPEKGKPLSAKTLLERNLASPAISPDGRWLVYVPMERYAQSVGSGFAARAGARLEAVRLESPQQPPVPIAIDLPGLCGQPSFSRDGSFLYFTQFLDDTNRDGVIDASDNGVLFRLPFQSAADDAPQKAAAGFAEQLTDGRRNCQYPIPGATELVATCSRRDGLDVFRLPLAGMVPTEWPNQRLWDEIDIASRREEQLLFYRHLLGRESVTRQKRRALVRLVLLHLELDQFAAAELYARHLNELADPTNPGMGRPLSVLVAHRKARNSRDQAGARFVEKARELFAELEPRPEEKKAALALGHFVRSEIADDLGDQELARRELESVRPEEQTSQAVFHVFYLRADAFYRSVDDRDGLVRTLRKFATHATLEKEDRCDYARALVRAATRGLSAEEADRQLEKEQAGVDPDSELGFALELGRAGLAIRNDDPPKDVREGLAKLYKKQTRQDRRRAVVLDAVQRAAAYDAERVIEGLSLLYLEDVPANSVERRAAVRLYQRATEGRAYRRLAKGRADKALEFFDAVVNKTGSYESLVEWLTLRLEAGATPEQLLAELDGRVQGKGSKALHNVAEAFLIAAGLPKLQGEAHAAAVEKATKVLKSTWSSFSKDRVAQGIYGEVLHQGFLRTGDLALAQRASNHYLVALDRARQSPRHLAAILGQLGMLNEAVGNWRIALGYLDEREKMPFLDDATSLAVKLARARVLLHVEKEEQAAKVADAALKLVDQTPKLAEYRLVSLDRAALYHLAAGHFARAVELYEEELPLLEGLPGPDGARNRLAVRLAHAAASMGAGKPQQTLDDSTVVDHGLADPSLLPALSWPHSTPEKVLRAYKLIASGLRAKSQAMLGQADAALRSLTERRGLFEAQLQETEREEDARALALVDAQLADGWRERGNLPAAAASVGNALQGTDAVLTKTGATVDTDQLRVLWLASDLQTASKVPAPADLGKRLREAHQATVDRRDPAMRGYLRWLEVYLAIVGGAEPAAAK